MNRVNFQTALRMIYPPRCLHCGKVVESDFGLCGSCWAQMPFASGVTCNLCGSSLMGSPTGDTALCDACILTPRPWQNGRAAMIYQGTARKLVLGLKHSDRTDIAGPAGRWIAQACHDFDETFKFGTCFRHAGIVTVVIGHTKLNNVMSENCDMSMSCYCLGNDNHSTASIIN